MMNESELKEFVEKCEKFYFSNSITNTELDQYFINASPDERKALTKIQNDVRKSYHEKVANDKIKLVNKLRDTVKGNRFADITKATYTLRNFLNVYQKHSSTFIAIDIFLISLYNLLKLQAKCNEGDRIFIWDLDFHIWTETL